MNHTLTNRRYRNSKSMVLGVKAAITRSEISWLMSASVSPIMMSSVPTVRIVLSEITEKQMKGTLFYLAEEGFRIGTVTPVSGTTMMILHLEGDLPDEVISQRARSKAATEANVALLAVAQDEADGVVAKLVSALHGVDVWPATSTSASLVPDRGTVKITLTLDEAAHLDTILRSK